MEYELYIQPLKENLKEKLKYIASKLEPMVCKEICGASIVDSGLFSDTLNTVLGGKIDKKTCEEVVSHYEKARLPFAWWIQSDTYSPQEKRCLEAQGFVFEEQEAAMVCDLEQVIQEYPHPNLTVQKCNHLNDYIDFAAVLASIFDPPDDQIEIFYKKAATLQLDQMLFFIGYENEIPVASSCLFLTDVAGIYDVATRFEKRGHGYGSFMFYQTLLEAKKRGYKVATLQASSEGIRIYKRFGFKKVCTFDIWNRNFDKKVRKPIFLKDG